jgi:hypothetical protein
MIYFQWNIFESDPIVDNLLKGIQGDPGGSKEIQGDPRRSRRIQVVPKGSKEIQEDPYFSLY